MPHVGGNSLPAAHPLDSFHGETEKPAVVSNLTGFEWAATRTTTVSLGAAVITTIKSLTTRHPGVGQIMRSPSAPQGSEPVEATVKWFNADKGFGFVALAGGSEAFMHIRQLETAGHSSVTEGARVKVRIGQGQKGPEVTEVIAVDASTARVAIKTERPDYRFAGRRSDQGNYRYRKYVQG